jgi:hypothetical protein
MAMQAVRGKRIKKKPQKASRRRGLAALSLGETGAYLQEFWSYARAGLSIFNTEVKMFDTYFSSLTNYAGNTVYCSGIAQGADWNQRGGNSVRLVGLEVSYIATMVGATSNGRMLLFQDNESRGAAPTLAETLELGGGSYGVVSPYEHKSVNRFNMLKDELFHWGTGNATGSVTVAKHFLLPTSNHVMWNGTTAAQGDSGEGALYVQYMGDLVGNSFNLLFWCRMFYVDN